MKTALHHAELILCAALILFGLSGCEWLYSPMPYTGMGGPGGPAPVLFRPTVPETHVIIIKREY